MTSAEIREYIRDNDVAPFLCRTRKSPLVLTGLFLELARQFYSDEQALYKGIKRYDPTGDCADGLYIESSNIWDPDETDQRPAIIVDLGDLQYSTQGVEDWTGEYDFDLKEGERIHARMVKGSVVFAHLAKTKGEAVNYASNTFDLFDGFSKVINDDFCFEKFDLRSILRPRLRKDQPKDFECLVQADFQFQELFAVKHESPKLKQISIKAASSIIQQFRMVK